MTNELNLHAPWDEVKAKLKEKNIQLTDDDLHYESGDENALLARLETKLNRSKQEVKEYIESISFNKGGAD